MTRKITVEYPDGTRREIPYNEEELGIQLIKRAVIEKYGKYIEGTRTFYILEGDFGIIIPYVRLKDQPIEEKYKLGYLKVERPLYKRPDTLRKRQLNVLICDKLMKKINERIEIIRSIPTITPHKLVAILLLLTLSALLIILTMYYLAPLPLIAVIILTIHTIRIKKLKDKLLERLESINRVYIDICERE